MLIAHFVYNYWSYSGATEQASKLANSLSATQDTRSVFINNTANNLKWFKITSGEKFDIVDVPNNPLLKFICIMFLHLKYRPDIYHFHGFHRLGLLFSAIFNKPSLLKCTLLGKDDLPSLKKSRFSFVNSFLLKRISKINCLNKLIYDLNSTCVNKQVLEIIPNGVVSQQSNSGGQIREYFLYAGAIVPRKRPLEVIKFFNTHYSHRGYKLVLAGPADSAIAEFDADYFAECLAEAARVDNSSIEFVGNLESSCLKEYYSKSMALIFFSLREGTPNVVLEAMSHDCPVIFCTDDVVVSNLMGSELTDLLSVKLDNLNTVSTETLSDIASSGSVSDRAKLFDIDEIAKLHYQLYLSLLN